MYILPVFIALFSLSAETRVREGEDVDVDVQQSLWELVSELAVVGVKKATTGLGVCSNINIPTEKVKEIERRERNFIFGLEGVLDLQIETEIEK